MARKNKKKKKNSFSWSSEPLTMALGLLGGAAEGGAFDKWLDPSGYKRRKRMGDIELAQQELLLKALRAQDAYNTNPDNALINMMGYGGALSRS